MHGPEILSEINSIQGRKEDHLKSSKKFNPLLSLIQVF